MTQYCCTYCWSIINNINTSEKNCVYYSKDVIYYEILLQKDKPFVTIEFPSKIKKIYCNIMCFNSAYPNKEMKCIRSCEIDSLYPKS